MNTLRVPLLAEVPENARLAPRHCLPDTVVAEKPASSATTPPVAAFLQASSGTQLVCFQFEIHDYTGFPANDDSAPASIRESVL